MIRQLKKKKDQEIKEKKQPKPNTKPQIKKTVNIGFQPEEAFLNFVNMKTSTVPLFTQVIDFYI